MAEIVVLNLYRTELDHFLNNPGGQVGQSLRKRGLIMVVQAKAQVGVDTGRLKQSIHMIHSRVGVYQQLWIGSREKHALIHHTGSRAHMIVPRRQEILRFSTNGRIVYSRTVRHPGTKPNHYLSDQLKYAYI